MRVYVSWYAVILTYPRKVNPKKACAKKNMATDEAERPKASKTAGYDARSVRRIDNVELLIRGDPI
jgi:hypothetical protein